MKNVTPRSLALDALVRIAVKKQSLDKVLSSLYESDLRASDKAFARQLMMSSLRHHGQLWSLIEPHLNESLSAKLMPIKWLLIMGAAQLLLLETPPHAAINTSVELAKEQGFARQSGLVNALLRKLNDESAMLPPASYNIPSWLKGAWRKAYGREAVEALAEQCTQEPPMDLLLKEEVAFEGEMLLPANLRVPTQDVTKLEGYHEGTFWVQDIAASLPVRALGDVGGKRVLDLCAAPGGKTMQLCAAGADVIAVDRSAARLGRMQENLARCHMQAACVEADVSKWTPDVSFDAVLLDAPCSATGTVRRHPDIWQRKTQSDIDEMVALQRTILAQVMTWLPANMPLVYAVCSLQSEEGEAQMHWLLETHDDLRLQPIKGLPEGWMNQKGCVRTLPHYLAEKGGMDGFFVARLVRKG